MFQAREGSAANAAGRRGKNKAHTLAEKRRGVRVNSQVPVFVEWHVEGRKFGGDAHTRIVGRYGCLLVLAQSLEVDQRVRVINRATGHANPAVVVWRGHKRSEGWEVGIELSSPGADFWGIEL